MPTPRSHTRIRNLLGLSEAEPIPKEKIGAVKMGTTVATNALLERKGEPTLLLITQGLGDLLRIGYQNRPRVFDLNIQLPELLYSEVAVIEERIAADGQVLQPCNIAQATQALAAALAAAGATESERNVLEQQVSNLIDPRLDAGRRGDGGTLPFGEAPVFCVRVQSLESDQAVVSYSSSFLFNRAL